MKPRHAIQKILICLPVLFCIFNNIAQGQENAVQPQGVYSSDFVIDGLPRTISFYIPYKYGKLDTYPVVLFLHAEGETGKTLLKKYGDILQQLADSFACILVCPDAFKGRWNTKIGEHAATDTVNDDGFLAIMADYFVQQYHGDPGRVYAAGFYNGAEMAWRLGCYMGAKLAGVGMFAPSGQAAAKTCSPPVYFDGSKYTPIAGKKFSNEAISAGWRFLMGNKSANMQQSLP